jgi:hypothetical protein
VHRYFEELVDEIAKLNAQPPTPIPAAPYDPLQRLLIGSNDTRGALLRPAGFDLSQPSAKWSDNRGEMVWEPGSFSHASVGGGGGSYRLQPNVTKEPSCYFVSGAAVPLLPNRRYILAAVVRSNFSRAGVEVNLGVLTHSHTHQMLNGSREFGLPSQSCDFSNTAGQNSGTTACVGSWMRWEVEFVTHASPELSTGQLILEAHGHARTETSAVELWIADLALIELPADALAPFPPGTGGSFRGSDAAAAMGMHVESVAETSRHRGGAAVIAVSTTGSHFRFELSSGVIQIDQRIGMQRELAEWRSANATWLSDLRVARHNMSEVVLVSASATLTVQADGLLSIVPLTKTNMTLVNLLGGDFVRAFGGSILAKDDYGGLSVTADTGRGTGRMPRWRLHSSSLAQRLEAISAADTQTAASAEPGWRCSWELEPGERLFSSVFPAREFSWATSFSDQWLLTLPDDSPSKYQQTSQVNQWVIWETFFEGANTGMRWGDDYVPVNESNVKAHVDAIHAAHAAAVPYVSGWFYHSRDPERWVASLAKLSAQYGFDGILSDGLPQDDFVAAYEEARLVRQLFPTGVVIIHDTLRQTGTAVAQWRPVIASYASATIMGELMTGRDGDQWPWAQSMSQFRSGNCIGSIKGNAWTGPGCDPPTSASGDGKECKNEALIALVLGGRSSNMPPADIHPEYWLARAALHELWKERGNETFFYDQFYMPAAQNATGMTQVGRAGMPISTVTGATAWTVALETRSVYGVVRYTISTTCAPPTNDSKVATTAIQVSAGECLCARTFVQGLAPSRELTLRNGALKKAKRVPPSALRAVQKFSPDPTEDLEQYGIFMPFLYFNCSADYQRVVKAAAKIPIWMSVCCDHTDPSSSGPAWPGSPWPVDGQPGSGLLNPNPCHLKNKMGQDINHALDDLRAAGVKITHYVHTRVTNYPNGSYAPCCQCCETLANITERIESEIAAYPADGIFIDNLRAGHIPAPAAWFQEVYDRTQAHGRRLVVSNPGGYLFPEPFMNITDIICAFESPGHVFTASDGGCGHVRRPGRQYPDCDRDFNFTPWRNKMSMLAYPTPADEWRPLLELAAKRDYTKFWFNDDDNGDTIPP